MKRRRSSCVPLKWKNCRRLRTENLNKPVSTTRDKAMFALPGTQNSYIQKLPVVVFGGTFRKTGEPAPPMRDYSGLVLLEVNHLSDLQEAVQIRQQAAMMPQTLLAFVGFSGKSVKIVIPFTLPDGTLPRLTRTGQTIPLASLLDGS
ncbi:MAG: BT4734/BF3469 family protein [Parabacteroides merdae]